MKYTSEKILENHAQKNQLECLSLSNSKEGNRGCALMNISDLIMWGLHKTYTNIHRLVVPHPPIF